MRNTFIRVIKTETRPVADFSKITVTGHCEIQWSNGKPALSIAVDQNLLALVKTVVSRAPERGWP
jgi:hypothetical protein